MPHWWNIVQSHTLPVWCISHYVTSVNTATETHATPVKHRSKLHVACRVIAAFKLHTGLLCNSGRWLSRVSRHQNIPTVRHGITLIPLWQTDLLHICLSTLPNVKHGTDVVQKDTEVDLVVVPKVTLRPLWHQNGYVPKWTTPWSRTWQVPNVT